MRSICILSLDITQQIKKQSTSVPSKETLCLLGQRNLTKLTGLDRMYRELSLVWCSNSSDSRLHVCMGPKI